MKPRNILVATMLLISIVSCKKDDSEPQSPFNGRTTAQFNPQKKYGTVTDIDGNEYKTIRIGEQEWMAENLRVTHYQNGENLSQNDYTWYREGDTIEQNTYSPNLVLQSTTNYTEADLEMIATYGFSYTWDAATDNRNIAPEGWRVPTSADWEKLINYLSDHNRDSIASYKLREKGNTHWQIDNDSPFLNISGFTANPWFPYAYGVSYWTTDTYESEYGSLLTTVCIQPGSASKWHTNDYSWMIPIRCIKIKQ